VGDQKLHAKAPGFGEGRALGRISLIAVGACCFSGEAKQGSTRQGFLLERWNLHPKANERRALNMSKWKHAVRSIQISMCVWGPSGSKPSQSHGSRSALIPLNGESRRD